MGGLFLTKVVSREAKWKDDLIVANTESWLLL